jgi:ribosomal protein L6P/L9E
MSRRTTSDTLNVTVVDSGDSIVISGYEREKVELVLNQLLKLGATVIHEPHVDGAKWTASCRRRDPPDSEIQVERLGHRLFIRGRSLERVSAKAAELTASGARREGEIVRIGAFYTAVFYDPSGNITPVA